MSRSQLLTKKLQISPHTKMVVGPAYHQQNNSSATCCLIKRVLIQVLLTKMGREKTADVFSTLTLELNRAQDRFTMLEASTALQGYTVMI